MLTFTESSSVLLNTAFGRNRAAERLTRPLLAAANGIEHALA